MFEIYNLLLNKIDSSQILLNEKMSKHTSFKVGGNADIFIRVKNRDELKYVLELSKKKNIPVNIIGNGTNLLVKDNGIRGIVIKLEFKNIFYESPNVIIAEAGALLSKVSREACKNSLSGIEFAVGIPGTIGGAIKMNSGAYNLSMKDVIIETDILDEDLNIKTLNLQEQQFNYRASIFQTKKYIVLRTKIGLVKKDKEEIKRLMEENIKSRKENQPLEFPSAGSVYKRGKEYITSKLIDEAGLKGFHIGDAYISEKHAGFIVNKGNAKAREIIELIEYTKNKIKEIFKVDIELELEVLGED